ncbi:MAG: AraC family transcriptional regulator [Eubacteriales bacterium]
MAIIRYIRRTYDRSPDDKIIPSAIQSSSIPYPKLQGSYFTDNIRFSSENGSFVCGHESAPPEYYSSTVTKGLFFTFVISGKGRFNGTQFGPRDFFIVHTDNKKDVLADKDDPWEIYWCAWKGEIAERPMSKLTKYEANTVYHLAEGFDFADLFDFLLYSAHRERNVYNIIRSFTDLLVYDLRFSKESEASDKKLAAMTLVKNYIDEHFIDVRVEEIANVFHFNRKYLSYAFKQATGMTMQSYIQRAKLHHAEELLLNQKYSINEVALRVGYENYSTFIKAFKKEYSLTPSEFLKINNI